MRGQPPCARPWTAQPFHSSLTCIEWDGGILDRPLCMHDLEVYPTSLIDHNPYALDVDTFARRSTAICSFWHLLDPLLLSVRQSVRQTVRQTEGWVGQSNATAKLTGCWHTLRLQSLPFALPPTSWKAFWKVFSFCQSVRQIDGVGLGRVDAAATALTE